MVNTVTCLLIVIGGIGYIVWWDIIRVIKNIRQNKRKIFGNLTLHSKIAIISTLLLIIVGAILVFVLEYDNPQTLKDYTLLQKIEPNAKIVLKGAYYVQSHLLKSEGGGGHAH